MVAGIPTIEDKTTLIEETLAEGSACFVDGKAGTIINGVCVPTEEPEEVVVEPVEEVPAKEVEPLPVSLPQSIEPKVAKWHTGDYNNPVVPENYGTEYGSAIPIYKQYGVPVGQFQSTVPFDWLNHNVPMALWMPDNTIVKAENPQEFQELLLLVRDNGKYLPSVSDFPERIGTPVYESVGELKSSVERERRLDTPERRKLEYWQTMERLAFNAQRDTETYKSIMERYEEAEVTPKLRGAEAAYQNRAQRNAGKYDIESIQANLEKAREEYATSLVNNIPKGMKVKFEPDMKFETVAGWKVGLAYETPEGDFTPIQFTQNETLLTDYMKQFPKMDLDETKKWAERSPDAFIKLLKSAGDTPETRVIVKSVFPELSKDEQEKLFASVSTKKQNVEKVAYGSREAANALDSGVAMKAATGTEKTWEYTPQAKWNEFIDIFGDRIKERQKETVDLFDNMPNKVRNVVLYIGRGISDISLMPFKVFEIAQEVWDKGITSFFRDEPYDLWEGKDLMTFGGVIGEQQEPFKITTKGLISWANPLYWLPLGRIAEMANPTRKLIATIARDFAKGIEKDVITSTYKSQAEKLGLKIETVVSDGEKLLKNSIKEAIAPKEITVPAKKEPYVPGEPYEGGKLAQEADGSWSEVKSVKYKRLEPNEPKPKPEDLMKDPETGVTYVKVKPEVKPVEPKVAQAKTLPVEKPLTETERAKAELDKALADWKPKAAKFFKSETGALGGDKESREFYEATVNLAKSAVNYGIKSADEFAQYLGVKLNETIKKAWDEAVPKTTAETKFEIPAGMRESEHFRKVNERLAGELGNNPLYKTVNLTEESAKAIKFVESNPDDALRIALGLKKPPSGILDTSISVAYENKLFNDGDIKGFTDVVNSLTLRRTRSGQEIVALKGVVNDNSPAHFIQKVIQARTEQVGNSLPKIKGEPTASASRVTSKIDKEAQKLKKFLDNKKLDIKSAQALIDELVCK